MPFLGILFAIFQISYLFLVQQGLDYATEHAARLIKTGQVSTANYSGTAAVNGDYFCKKVISQFLPSYLNCQNLIVDARTSSSNTWSSLNTSTLSNATTYLSASNQSFCLGSPGSIVVLRVVYPVPAMLSIMTVNQSLANVGASSAGQTTYSGTTGGALSGTSTFTNRSVYPIMGVYAFQAEPYTPLSATTIPGC